MNLSKKYPACYVVIFFMMTLLVSPSCNRPVVVEFRPELGVATGISNAGVLADNGFNFIEESVGGFLMPLRSEGEFLEKLSQARQAPIPVKACNGFIPGNMKSVGPEAVHDEILTFAETAFRRAEMAGVAVIVFGSGGSRRIPEGFSREEAMDQFVALGKAMAPLAQKHGVVVALEPLNTNEVNFINNLAEGAEIVEAINHPSFRLLADIYHMLMEEEGPENIITYGYLIHHVHVAEKEGRATPGTHEEDLSAYYQALRTIGYRGRISIEGRWESMEEQAAKALLTIKSQL